MNQNDIALTIQKAFNLPRDLQYVLREYGVQKVSNYLVCCNKLDLSNYGEVDNFIREKCLKIERNRTGNKYRHGIFITNRKITYHIDVSYNAITHTQHCLGSKVMICTNIFNDYIQYVVYSQLNKENMRKIVSKRTKKNSLFAICNTPIEV